MVVVLLGFVFAAALLDEARIKKLNERIAAFSGRRRDSRTSEAKTRAQHHVSSMSTQATCGVQLVEQTSRAACRIGHNFGCLDEGTMWVANCRGRFRCSP